MVNEAANTRLNWGRTPRIDYDGARTPLKTTLFVVLCLAWIVPGLVGHDPWKIDEAIVFGMVADIVRSGDWLTFHIAGEASFGRAPLFVWTAALFGKALGGLMPLHDAARLAAGFYMALTAALLSGACQALMGERAVRMGVLLFLGSLGLLFRAHELNTDLAGLSGIAMSLYGLALALRRPALGGAVAGAGLGLAFLGDGFLPAGMVLALLLVLPLAGPAWRTRDYGRTAIVALACAAPLLAAWPIALYLADPGLLQTWLQNAGVGGVGDPIWPAGIADLVYYARLLPWYAWPAWPLAAWSLWRARRVLAERNDLLLPLTALLAFFVAVSIFGGSRDVNALPLLLPLAMLGVAELDSVPRGAASALDWFGMTTFFLFAALLWVGWAAALTGSPEFAVKWIQREVPGFRYEFRFLAFALASLLTLVWLVVVARSLRSTRRAVVNWAAGITMVWMLMMTLGVPLVDQARSYRVVASKIVENLPPGFTCVAREANVGDAQRALLDYFVGLRTVPIDWPMAQRCGALLAQGSPRAPDAAPPGWREAWRGSRPGDRHEHFVLYRRN